MKYSVLIFLLAVLTGCSSDSDSKVSQPEVADLRSSDAQISVFWDDSHTHDSDSNNSYIGASNQLGSWDIQGHIFNPEVPEVVSPYLPSQIGIP